MTSERRNLPWKANATAYQDRNVNTTYTPEWRRQQLTTRMGNPLGRNVPCDRTLTVVL